MHVPQTITTSQNRVAVAVFFDIAVIDVQVHRDVWLAYVIDEINRLLGGVEQIRLISIDGF